MTVKPLTINEVLRFANHDFLNHLHLIQMNLDLDQVEEAKEIIQNISDHCKILSNLNKTQLTSTLEWLQTFAWRYPAIELTLTSNVLQAVNTKFDEDIVQYLENTIIHVYDELDPFTEQQLQIAIESNADQFQLTFDLKGNWHATQFNKEIKQMHINMIEATNKSLHYILSAKQE
ncbi:Spo0B domain-containing protein [Solibacillus sp. CAU 1738]|uniref:Spo0B domain-containing protein n=1 Tax=Solibacillus sp. CAU 1738 TaxID=3140363 RepID=UPI003260DE18